MKGRIWCATGIRIAYFYAVCYKISGAYQMLHERKNAVRFEKMGDFCHVIIRKPTGKIL